ncbi:MAG: hypothetical protein ABIY62_02690, partial [Ginsengibacter sp.]
MEENNFEKQVQHKMDEFNVQPSEDVWKKIEVRIEKKKNSKWGLIILILFFITAGGGFWLWNGFQQTPLKNSMVRNNKQEISIQNNNAQKNISVEKIDTITDSANNKKNASGKNLFPKKDAYKGIVTKDETSALSADPRKTKRRLSVAVISSGSLEVINGTTGKTAGEKQIEKNEIQISSEDRSTQPFNLNDNGVGSLANTFDLMNQNETEMNDILKKPISKNDIRKFPSEQMLHIAFKDPIAKNKWHFGINISGGISGISNSVLNGGNSANYFFSPNASSGQVTQPYNYSLSFKNGFAYFAGVFAEKNVGRKIKISFGLNFRSLKSTYKPGADTGVFYYSQPAVKNFHAHYNFIDLPLNIKFLIGKASRPDIVLQGGIVISQMTGSNALQFDPSKGYFKDNSLFNKTQFGFNGAAYTTLFSRQKHPLYVGPYFYY